MRRCRHEPDGRGGRHSAPLLSPGASRRVRASAAAALAALAVWPACKPPSVDVTLADPQGLRAGATYAEFLVFGDACPSQDDLIARDFPEPLVDQRLDVDEAFDELGTLDAKRYGFAAILRTDDCGVLGAGCSEADLSERIDSVLIPLLDVFPLQGACPGECSKGLCE